MLKITAIAQDARRQVQALLLLSDAQAVEEAAEQLQGTVDALVDAAAENAWTANLRTQGLAEWSVYLSTPTSVGHALWKKFPVGQEKALETEVVAAVARAWPDEPVSANFYGGLLCGVSTLHQFEDGAARHTARALIDPRRADGSAILGPLERNARASGPMVEAES